MRIRRHPQPPQLKLPVNCLVSNFKSEQFVRYHDKLHTDDELNLSEGLLTRLLDQISIMI